MEIPYSYHTFLFPFLWNDAGCVTRGGFERILRGSSYWQPTNMEEESFHRTHDTRSIEDAREDYQAYQYFNHAARRAVFGVGSDIVSNYTFDPDAMRNKAVYHIHRGEDRYDLPINGIKLRIYNTGVGIMAFEVENHDYRSIRDVKQINEYGRRISVPFLPNESGFMLCADRLGVSVNGKTVWSEFQKDLARVQTAEDIREHVSFTYVAEMIKKLLTIGTPFHVTSRADKKREKDTFYIEPVLDDRMFVCCLVRDDSFIRRIVGSADEIGKGNTYPYETDYNTAKDLYALIFVDGDGASCQNTSMIHELLLEHIYRRWGDYGTLYAATHHSFFCLAKEDQGIDPIVVYPFLSIYIRMQTLALAQRASIIAFEHRAAVIADGIENSGIRIRGKRLSMLLDLQEAFVACQNQLLLFEISSQEQAIELYKKMQATLYIREEKQELREQMESLYEAANSNLNDVFNSWAFVFAFVSILFMVIFEQVPDTSPPEFVWALLAGASLLSLLLKWLFRRRIRVRRR